MNVFMSPVPWGVSDAVIHKCLKLYLDDLGIYAFSFHAFANKPKSGQIKRKSYRGQNSGRNGSQSNCIRSAIVTLPIIELGQKFLDRHGYGA